MNSIINRLFQKSDIPTEQVLDPSNSYAEFLRHFYSKGYSSKKLDILKEKISKITYDLEDGDVNYQLVQSYLDIEYYLTIQDAGFLENTEILRAELNELYPEIANSKPFSILYSGDNQQEIELALLLADYVYELASDHCGYIPVLSPEFTVRRDIQLTDVEENLVYYLSCRRKISEFIENLSKAVGEACLEKKIENPLKEWYIQFFNFYENLKVSSKLDHYFSEEPSIIENQVVPETTKKLEVNIVEPKKEILTSEYTNAGASLHTAIIENMLDKALIFERSGKLLLANEAARNFFNLPNENLDIQNIFDLLPQDISLELKADIDDQSHKREKVVLGQKKDIHLKKTDDILGYFEIATSNNYTEGEDTYSMFFKDITKKRDTLDSMSKEMEHVQRAAKAKSTFLSNMSHEIRTPLNVILGLTDIIKKGENEDAELFVKNIDGIDFSAKSLLSIVNDILDFSKIEAGKLSIQSYDYNLRKVITALADGFTTKANENGVNLNTEIDPNIPDIVVGDQYRLNQILTNLIGNAIKFTNEGEIKIIATHKEIDQDQIEVHFEVKDSGIGIPADKLNHIFDSFYRVEDTGHSNANGTGLGLAITKELIHLQQGELTATSVAGEGSSFCFTLPLLKSNLQSTEETNKGKDRNDKQLEGLRVLVAEDNTMNQFYIKQLLNRLNIDVDIAENGKEAVDIYNVKENGYYNLILMDMHMPILGGVDAIKKIRNSHKDSLKKVPIVICSADVFPESRKEAMKAGIDFYLTKPVDEDALKEVLFWLISDEEPDLVLYSTPKDESRSSSVNIDKLLETFDHDEEFIISLLEVFIADTPDDYKSLRTCMEREFYPRATELAHKMKSSFMNLGMTHQGHFLQQIEKNIGTHAGVETGKKYYEQFKKIYTKTLLDVNILLIELKRD